MSNRKDSPEKLIAVQLLEAARERTASSSKPWDYGWCDESYRRSEDAALSYKPGLSVRLSRSGVEAFEAAVMALLKISSVADAYDKEEFWGVVGGLVGTLPLGGEPDDLRKLIESRLQRLVATTVAWVLFPVCHVASPSSVLEFGPLRIGSGKEIWASLPDETRAKLGDSPHYSSLWWYPTPAGPQESIVLCAYSTHRQLEQAFHDAQKAFDDLISLALMSEPDLDSLGLYSLRGDTHRPGVRGIKLDRHSLSEIAKRQDGVTKELAASVLTTGLLGPHVSHHWLGEDPFPLERLLGKPQRRERVGFLLGNESSVTKRLRAAARWHAKAYWADEMDDAVLALGIAFDLMLKERGNSPGRVHAERYAFLSAKPDERPERYRRFQGEYYAARSAVAHGGRTSASTAQFVRAMAADVRQVFLQVSEFAEVRGLKTEEEYDEMFEGLKWGRG
jgi:hypothetical protein